MVEIGQIDLNAINVDELEFPDKIITFMDWVREMPEEMQAPINSIAVNICKIIKGDFMEFQKLPYEKGMKFISKYQKQKKIREEKSFLAKRSKSS